MTIESGAPAASKRTWIIGVIVCLALGGWFLRDWAQKYPQENREEAQKLLTDVPAANLELGAAPTADDVHALNSTRPKTLDELTKRFGPPIRTQDEPGGATACQFASLYGLMTVRHRGGAITADAIAWRDWGHRKDQIEGQLYFGIGCGVLALYPLFRLFKTMTLKVVVDDGGMTYDGRRIAWDEMRDLRDYNDKGWIDLYFAASGAETKLRLDNQRVDKFDEIVTAIADRKGFANPIKK